MLRTVKFKYDLQKGVFWRTVPLSAVFLLLLLALFAFSPVVTNSLGALDTLGELTGLAVNDAQAESSAFSGWLSPSVRLELEDTVAQDVLPLPDGSFTVLSTVAHVVVSNSDYYNVTIAGEEDMTGVDGYVGITGITEAKAGTSFEPNEWGYTVAKNDSGSSSAIVATRGTVYQPMTTDGVEVPTGSSSTAHLENGYANDYYSLNFAALIDTTIPADTYTSNVLFSVVASPKLVTGFDRVSTMQQLTPEICAEIGTERDTSIGYKYTDQLGKSYYTKRLRDERDNKEYWVAKLADGNCWMTQNLAVDIPAGEISATSSIEYNKKFYEGSAMSKSWTPVEGTRNVDKMTEEEKAKRFLIAECPVAGGGKYGTENNLYDTEWDCLNANAGYSWDEGQYVLFYPGKGDEKLYTGFTAAQGGLAGFASAEKLAEIGVTNLPSEILYNGGLVVNVDGWTANTDPEFTASSSETKQAGQTIDAANKIYDAHYLIGNYYQWYAATAQALKDGNDKADNNGEPVESSICPKNWILPTSGSTYNSNPEYPTSFYNLIAKSYTALTDGTLSGGTDDGDSSATFATNTNLEKVMSGSLKFLRSGNVNPSSINLQVRNVGGSGNWWSSVSGSATDARHLHFSAVAISPSYSSNRGGGFPVRCLVNGN